jgi:hypothetical protein
MTTKKFSCKAEEVTAIAGFVAESMNEDMADFQGYSPDFSPNYVQQILTKRKVCLELEKAGITTQKLKKVTETLVTAEQNLRPSLNLVEGYVSRAKESLDVAPESFGLHTLRDAISRGNDEGIISGLQTVLANIKRNIAPLQAKGLKQELIDALSASYTTIDQLNNQQNKLADERSAATAANIGDYNELWGLISPIMEAGRLLYRGVDEVKLKKYTLALLIKRVNAEGSNKSTAKNAK